MLMWSGLLIPERTSGQEVIGPRLTYYNIEHSASFTQPPTVQYWFVHLTTFCPYTEKPPL